MNGNLWINCNDMLLMRGLIFFNSESVLEWNVDLLGILIGRFFVFDGRFIGLELFGFFGSN